jgi:hypothetical protein
MQDKILYIRFFLLPIYGEVVIYKCWKTRVLGQSTQQKADLHGVSAQAGP